jgi:hypothetical protein
MSIGATTRSTGAFTTLASNGATTFTAGTASTTTGTGTLVITGGLGVSGRINAANFDGIIGANTAAAGAFTTLSATGVTTVQAGTALLPAITTTGDTNTGIWFPAADTIAFTEGGVESMRINSSGKVNIGGATSATVMLEVIGTDAMLVPVGTTAQRPTGASGYLRFNSSITQFEGYNGTAWSSVGGGATGGGADQVFIENSLIVTTNYTITTSKNAMSTGPITINSGVTVTIPTGARWVVL